MHLICEIESLNKIVQKYFVKNTITNNYLLPEACGQFISQKRLFFVASGSNACILLKKTEFFQLYYYLNNQNELIELDVDLPITMEILYRDETKRPEEILFYWEKCGFKQHLTRENMVATYNQITLPAAIDDDSLYLRYADTEEEILFTKNLFERSLDKYTGDILSYEEVHAFSKKKQVICAYYHSEPAGALQFDIKNSIVWLGHIAVANEFRGKGVANELVKAYIQYNVENNNTRYQLWVIQNNIGAINLYRKFGFVYGNKSTVSMLKK